MNLTRCCFFSAKMQQNQDFELSDLSPMSYVEYRIDEPIGPVGRMRHFEEVNDVYEATDILATEKEMILPLGSTVFVHGWFIGRGSVL